MIYLFVVCLLHYINGVLIFINSMSEVNKLKTFLRRKFDINDLGTIKKIFGMEIYKDNSKRLWLS